jgi:hypothetical protein
MGIAVLNVRIGYDNKRIGFRQGKGPVGAAQKVKGVPVPKTAVQIIGYKEAEQIHRTGFQEKDQNQGNPAKEPLRPVKQRRFRYHVKLTPAL